MKDVEVVLMGQNEAAVQKIAEAIREMLIDYKIPHWCKPQIQAISGSMNHVGSCKDIYVILKIDATVT